VPPVEKRSRSGLLAGAGVIAVLGLAVGVTAAIGGLRREPSGPARTGPGRPVDVSLFKVVPLDARMTAIRQFGGPPKNAVVVRARVTDLGDRSWGITTFLDGVSAEPTPGHLADPDSLESTGVIGGEKTGEIHPRMPIEVRMVWTLPKGLSPRNLTVVFRQWSYGQSFTSDEFEWTIGHDSPVVAEVTFPVRSGGRP
jgi:hypothetical protein